MYIHNYSSLSITFSTKLGSNIIIVSFNRFISLRFMWCSVMQIIWGGSEYTWHNNSLDFFLRLLTFWWYIVRYLLFKMECLETQLVLGFNSIKNQYFSLLDSVSFVELWYPLSSCPYNQNFEVLYHYLIKVLDAGIDILYQYPRLSSLCVCVIHMWLTSGLWNVTNCSVVYLFLCFRLVWCRQEVPAENRYYNYMVLHPGRP